MTVFEQDINKLSEKTRFLHGKSIFITGATGLIGSVAVRSLILANEKGANINIIAHVRNRQKAEAMFGDKVTCFVADIEEPISYGGKVDYILHLASETASVNLNGKPVETVKTAVNGTFNALEFAKEKQVIKFVYASSMEAYGKVEGQERIEEDKLGFIDLGNVRNCYPESKRLCELLVKSYFAEYRLNGVSARLAQTFGAGVSLTDNRVFMQFAKSVISEKDIVLHTMGQSVGNYCYTTDTVAALFLLLEKGVSGETYNVVNERSTMTIRQMAEMCAQKISGKIKVVYDIPEGNAYGYAAPTELRLSGKKLYGLGFVPEYDLEQSYIRLICDLKERL